MKLPAAIGSPRAALMGICSDNGSSFMRGAASAPALIREAMQCPSANGYSELGVPIMEGLREWGNVSQEEYPTPAERRSEVRKRIQEMVKEKLHPMVLGGDHAITWPSFEALAHSLDCPLAILHLDAHPDLYADFEGNTHSHASPFARILEGGCCSKLVQVGIRATTPEQRELGRQAGVEVMEMRHMPDTAAKLAEWLDVVLPAAAPLYVSLDLDVFEPGLVPGVAHYEPGGMTPRFVIDLIHGIPRPVVGADVVELNPYRDINGVTAMVAAKV
ncbi:unnamed protein product [Chrysoparadoxa australica]